jgi:hypothetical protein
MSCQRAHDAGEEELNVIRQYIQKCSENVLRKELIIEAVPDDNGLPAQRGRVMLLMLFGYPPAPP